METSADDSSSRGRRVHGCWPDDQFAFQNNFPRQEINARPPAEYMLTASDTVASLAVMLDNSPTLLDPLKRLPAETAAVLLDATLHQILAAPLRLGG